MGRVRDFETTKGDTRTPLGATLAQSGAAVDLTGLSVEFKMIDASDGSTKRDWIAASLVVAASGQVQYDFAAADVDTAGTFYYWFRIVDGGEYDTFPSEGREARIIISDTV